MQLLLVELCLWMLVDLVDLDEALDCDYVDLRIYLDRRKVLGKERGQAQVRRPKSLRFEKQQRKLGLMSKKAGKLELEKTVGQELEPERWREMRLRRHWNNNWEISSFPCIRPNNYHKTQNQTKQPIYLTPFF